MGITVLRGLTMGVKSTTVLERCLCVVYWNHFDDYVYVILVWLWASVQVINWKFIPRPHRAEVYPPCLLITWLQNASCTAKDMQNITSRAGGRHDMPPPMQVHLWPFYLESGVRVTCDVGNLCANFSLPRPLSFTPDERDRPYRRKTRIIA